ncbi:unnamed protein product [Schistocephalus solidus]|uniref:STAS domain-containing protein n=1 Tax=Schistocephalus solidus TaxID=70667 RepID=A0A3P7CGI9_SCHSO|nr:unnamed protein product [Schistocephalus solidus]
MFQLAFGILRLGFVTRFLSDPMISGFTVGSAVHVVVSQLKTVFGLSVPRQSGLFHVPLVPTSKVDTRPTPPSVRKSHRKTYSPKQLIIDPRKKRYEVHLSKAGVLETGTAVESRPKAEREFYEICKKLPQTNLASLGLSLVFIALLYCFRRWINPLVMKKVKVPVPMELVVVVLGGVISYCMQLQAKHGVKVVGFVPSGLPVPCAPDLSMTVSLVADVIVIALVVFSISYSLAAVYAKKLGYAVEANQELLAYGMTNILSSFFLCFPAAASLSRSALTVSMNGMSEIAGLVGAAVVLLVVLFAGPLFYPVPNLSWTITFVATIFLDVIYGLIVGILFAAFSVLLRAQRQKVEVLGHFGGTEVFDSSAGYKVCEETPSIKVIRYHGSIFYACGEHFVQSIISAAGFDPRIVRFHEEKLKKGIALLERQINFHPEYKSDVGCAVSIPADIVLADGDGSHKRTQANHFTVEPAGDVIKSSESNSQHSDAPCCCNCSALCSRNNLQPVGRLLEKQASLQAHLNALTAAIPLTHIILDCAPWNFVDIVGIELLQGLIKDFNAIGVQVYLAGVSESIRQSMEQCDFFKTVEVSTLFISVFDAFLSIKVASGSPSTILSSPSPTTDILLSSGSVEISAAVAP